MKARAAALLFANLCVVSCARSTKDQTETSASNSSPSTSAQPPSPTPTKAPPSGPEEKASALRRALEKQEIKAIEVVGWNQPSHFRARLARPEGEGEVDATILLALVEDPLALRGPLAFETLARALQTRVVPAAARRRIGTGELGALLPQANGVRDYFAAHAAVQNDGTIDALVLAPSRGDAPEAWTPLAGRDVAVDGSVESIRWARWAASPDKLPDEDASLLRDYVETLALDYLAGNVLRRVVHLDDARSAIHLTDNATAFPGKVDPRALDLLLARLRPVARFPRSLRDALVRLDRPRAEELFKGGPFASWLVPPRTLVDLDERRKSLLTLIEARVAERGEASVLGL